MQTVACKFLWRKRKKAINETDIRKTTTIQKKTTVLEKNQTSNEEEIVGSNGIQTEGKGHVYIKEFDLTLT